MKKIVILHNIRSAHNVGAIFRTADGAGVAKIYLTGYTPAPLDRFGRISEEIRKTSLGATESVAWEETEMVDTVLKKLREDSVQIVVVEQHRRSIPYSTYISVGDTAYIFGNEIEGVPESLCEEADTVIEIPMQGIKESLNVSVATGIILFHTNV